MFILFNESIWIIKYIFFFILYISLFIHILSIQFKSTDDISNIEKIESYSADFNENSSIATSEISQQIKILSSQQKLSEPSINNRFLNLVYIFQLQISICIIVLINGYSSFTNSKNKSDLEFTAEERIKSW